MNQSPFSRDRMVDKPGIMGARWWHQSLADQGGQVQRRDAIRSILIATAVIAGLGVGLTMCVSAASGPSKSDYRDERRTTLDMQKAHGWNFGAVGEALVFDGLTTKPFSTGALMTIQNDLSPSEAKHVPFYQPTLFSSPYATPTSLSTIDPDEVVGFQPLANSMKPIFTSAMDVAYNVGKAFATLFTPLADKGGSPGDAKVAVIVDLPGPEAVAFAAGAAAAFDPVFLFDNWPHPRGVVKAQETLSAAAYYQPLFSREKSNRQSGKSYTPMFVLDRRRLANYADDATQFDNRYVAKLPWPAVSLSSLGVSRVLYIVPTRADTSRESDDINDELVAYSKAGIDVKAMSLDMFGRSAQPIAAAYAGADAGGPIPDTGGYYYGGTPGSHYYFWTDYPWVRSPRTPLARPTSNPGTSYRPVARTTTYSSGTGSAASKPRPSTFATVAVVVAAGTGAIIASKYSRSGSWNRSSGNWGG